MNLESVKHNLREINHLTSSLRLALEDGTLDHLASDLISDSYKGMKAALTVCKAVKSERENRKQLTFF